MLIFFELGGHKWQKIFKKKKFFIRARRTYRKCTQGLAAASEAIGIVFSEIALYGARTRKKESSFTRRILLGPAYGGIRADRDGRPPLKAAREDNGGGGVPCRFSGFGRLQNVSFFTGQQGTLRALVCVGNFSHQSAYFFFSSNVFQWVIFRNKLLSLGSDLTMPFSTVSLVLRK